MVAYGDNSQEVFLGHSVTQSKNVSEATAQAIDAEVRAIIDASYARAKKLLTDNRHELDAIAKALLEYETLSGDELRQVLKGEPIDRTRPDEPVNTRGSVPTAGRPKPRPAGDAGMAPGPAPA
jgi:cell division protease FtsH